MARSQLQRASLSLRIIVLLSVALLPLGAIAILQAGQLSRETTEKASNALVALTEQAAFRERQVIERTIGAADALGAVLPLIKDDAAACQRYLSQYVAQTNRYSFIGFQDTDGIISCSSAGGVYDYSGSAQFAEIMADPRPYVFADRSAQISQTSVMVVTHPAYEDEILSGHVIMSVPHASFEPTNDLNVTQNPFVLITFNKGGMILTSENEARIARQRLPDQFDLTLLATDQPVTFTGTSASGEPREYAAVPIIPGTVFALGSWEVDISPLGRFAPVTSTVILSGVMWLASIVVAFFAINQLIVRGIRNLSTQIQQFSVNRAMPDKAPDGMGELGDLQIAFHDMAETTIRDEAALENAVHEKQVLLKEVHHRVKNNLQLVSSIMGMQRRENVNPETKEVVGRLQDRVTALASVHRALYEAEDIGTIDAGQTLRKIINQIMAMALTEEKKLRVQTELDGVLLYPDQAVPLSLLMSEAVTNSLKYIGGPDPKITIKLHMTSDKEARLQVLNTLGDTPAAAHESTGLGTQLIKAFVSQLDGELVTKTQDHLYSVSVIFPVHPFDPDHGDEASRKPAPLSN